MKRLLLTLTIVFTTTLLTFCQQNPKFEKVDSTAIDKEKLSFVTELADKIFIAQQQGGFYSLQEPEATPEMIEGLNEKVQKQSYMQIEMLYGAYKSLEFDHLMKSKSEPVYELYRFRGHFKTEEAKVEVRAVLNAEGKLGGFFVRPWRDEIE